MSKHTAQKKSIFTFHLLTQCITVLCNHLALFSIYALGLALVSTFTTISPLNGWKYLVLAICPLAYYFLRVHCKHFISLFLMSAAVVACTVILPLWSRPGDRFMAGAVCVGYLIASIRRRFVEISPEDDPMLPVLGFCFCGVSMFVLNRLISDGRIPADFAGNQLYYMTVLGFGLYLICLFLNSYTGFVNLNRTSADVLPEDRILHNGIFLAGLFSGLGILLLMGIARFDVISDIFHWIAAQIKKFTRWFFSHFHGSEEVVEEAIREQNTQSGGGGMALPEGEAGIFWIYLEYIVIAIALVAIVVGVIYGVFKLCLYLHNAMQRRQKSFGIEIATAGVTDVRESLKENGTDALPRNSLFRKKNNNETVRLLYRKHILKRSRSVEDCRPEFLTAREWQEKLSEPGSAEIYEKARYSGQECSSEDLQALKQAYR